MFARLRNCCFLFIGFWLSNTNQAAAQPAFAEVAAAYGIDHYHRGFYGGGVAIFDFNNDGFEDIYLTGGLFRDKLYKNNGNKTFTDVTLIAGFSRTSQFNTSSVSIGDINNDGFDDLFIGTFRNQHNLLYLNNGDNSFTEISSEAGLEKYEWAIGGSFADFNLDGYLDLYVVNYVATERLIFDDDGNVLGFDHDCFPNQLFINNGDLTFKEVQSAAINNEGCGLAVAATDFNGDFRPDVYVANDFGEFIVPNAALQNVDADSLFQDVSIATGLNAAIYGMGIAIGDYNRDGNKDYYITNIGSNFLYQNQGDGTFRDVAVEAGVANTLVGDKFATSWGAAFFDYDHDGHEDLFVSNGFVRAAAFISTTIPDPNQLYKNLGDGTFENVARDLGLDDANISRGMALGDLDNDGDLDIVVSKVGDRDTVGNTLIYENRLDNNYHWLKVKLAGTESNPDGYGAAVKAYADGVQWLHEIDGGSSHASHHSAVAHFGLGEVSVLDSLVITWPGGSNQRFLNVPSNQFVFVQEGEPEYMILGCMDAAFDNYNPDATLNYGCYRDLPGCLDQLSPYFNMEANIPVEECNVEPLSVGDISKTSIYPIPAMDLLTVEYHDAISTDFQIISLSGSKLMQGKLIKGTNSISRRDIPAGIYLLQINTGNRQPYTYKIRFQ